MVLTKQFPVRSCFLIPTQTVPVGILISHFHSNYEYSSGNFWFPMVFLSSSVLYNPAEISMLYLKIPYCTVRTEKKRFSPEIVPHVPHAPMLFCLLKHFVQFTNERIIYDESLTRATKSYLIRSMMKSSQPTSRHVCMYIRNTYICLTGLGPSMYRDMPVYLNLAEVRIHLVHITCLYYK